MKGSPGSSLSPGYEVLPPLSLSELKEQQKKEIILSISGLIKGIYNSNKILNATDSKVFKEKALVKIIFKMKKSGISLPGKTHILYEISDFFRKSGYFFNVSNIKLGKNKYILSIELYRLGKPEIFTVSNIRFPGLTSINGKFLALSVKKTYSPDFRTTESYKKMTGKSVTLYAGTYTKETFGTSTIVFYTKAMREGAKKQGIPYKNFKITTMLNELGHIYFNKVIPSKVHGHKLHEFGINLPRDLSISPHLSEAFSDWCSLKYSKNPIPELMRILGSNGSYNYKLSLYLAKWGLKNAFKKKNLILPKNITIKQINKRLNLINPSELSDIINDIIKHYEKNIGIMLSSIIPKIKK